ncbi:hypothetical protein CASFOL_012458 [Castilleja foliolosa]|uniref:SKP1 component dimerisation domain-containing protein n=1 Tax=Castilleja foliolosa TaxID=1961234 RepID=A0ABD3DHP7_9LAMI
MNKKITHKGSKSTMASQGESSSAAGNKKSTLIGSPAHDSGSSLAIDIIRTYLKAQDGDDEAKKKFEAEFAHINPETHVLFEVINRAHKLDLTDVVEIASRKIADELQNRPISWIRKVFNIKDDFTAEEKAKVKAETAWAFEDYEFDDDF